MRSIQLTFSISAILDIGKKILEKIFKKREVPEELKEEIETAYILIALGLLIGSLLIGMIKGNTALWILLAIISLFFIYKAFPDVWQFSLNIVLIYSFGGFGGFLLARGEFLYYIIGGILEVIAVYSIFSFRRKVILLREKLKKDTPIGLWFLSLFLFFGLANLSLIDISFWIDKKFSAIPYLNAYIGIEIIIILLILYNLLFLQRKLVRGKVVKKIVYEKCPLCKTNMVKESLICPNCNNEEEIYWCLVREHYIVKCVNCNKKTPIGKSCIHCGKEIPKDLTCDNCKKSFHISAWKK